MIVKADCMLVGGGFQDVQPGVARVEDGRIAELGSSVSTSGEPVCDFRLAGGGDRLSVIIPGLIDCHCHLELSRLGGKIRSRGSLVRWLGELVVKRPKRWLSQRTAVRAGVCESLAAGTTTVADISANGRSWQAMTDSLIRKICFAEVIGIGTRRDRGLAKLDETLAAMPTDDPMLLRGISPHAPYSTDASVYQQAMALADREGLRLTTHLAEDPAEIEFVRSGTGPWRRVLKGLGLWDETITPFGGGAVEWAKSIGLLSRPTILAHVNYVDDNDLALLAAGRASVVYCPLPHAYFGHPTHRYREMIAAGITVALGNDSRACSPALSILRQMQAVYQAGGLSPRAVLAMGTTSAARALQWDGVIGTLRVGASADLTIVTVEKPTKNIARAILSRETQVLTTIVAGRPAFS